MPIIACIGWGSLIWDPRELPVQRQWFKDGPFLPVEFARQSADGRITLVIKQGSRHVRALWAVFDTDNLAEARNALMRREGSNLDAISVWSQGQSAPEAIPGIGEWARMAGVDTAVWTGLKSQFQGHSVIPSEDQVLAYLKGLRGNVRENAERYIRRAPRQIDTAFRRRIEAELGWTPTDIWPPPGRLSPAH